MYDHPQHKLTPYGLISDRMGGIKSATECTRAVGYITSVAFLP